MVELNLPVSAILDKNIPKNNFYDSKYTNVKIKREFIDIIKKITWKYKLAESTIGIQKTENVEEIQIFEIELKERVIPKKVLQVIDTSIPYPILYRFLYEDDEAFGISLKSHKTIGNYYFSEWNDELLFNFSGINLEIVYQKLIKAFISETIQNNADFYDIIYTDKKIKQLAEEIERLSNKINKEKQFNRKVEIHKVMLEKSRLLSELKGEIL